MANMLKAPYVPPDRLHGLVFVVVQPGSTVPVAAFRHKLSADAHAAALNQYPTGRYVVEDWSR